MNKTFKITKENLRYVILMIVSIGLCIFAISYKMASKAAVVREAADTKNLSGPIKDVNSGLVKYNYVYLGIYPQTEVVEADLIDELTDADYNADDIAVIDNISYKRIAASEGVYTYFTLEPIKWRILENDGTNLTLQSAQILDCRQFHEQNNMSYENCSLRSWLNADFINAAFSNHAVEGLKAVSGADKVTILDVNSIESGKYCLSGESCILTTTDYAVANDCYATDFSGSSSGTYWVRGEDTVSRYVDSIGELHDKEASSKDCGVAPVIRLSVDEYFYSVDVPVMKNPDVDTVNKVTKWDTLYLGSYPQTEITEPSASVIHGNYNNDVAVVDGVRYKRIPENNTYRYFRFDAIRWRILDKEAGNYLLQCDLLVEMYQRSTTDDDSGLVEWLNTDFYNTAFPGIIQNNLVPFSDDEYVRIPSDSMLHSLKYGYQNDICRKFAPSDYAEAISLIGKEESAVYWFCSAENGIDGYVNKEGSVVYYKPTGVKGVCPVIKMKEIPYVWGKSESTVIDLLPDNTSSPTGSPVPDETMAPVETDVPAVINTPTPSMVATNPPVPTKSPSRYFTNKRPVVNIKTSSANSHKLSWKKIAGATGYSVYKSTSQTGTYSLYKNVKGNSVTVKKLKKGKKYYYVVIAYKKTKGLLSYSKTSKVVSGRAGNPRQPRITITTSSHQGKKYVSIHWRNVSDATYIQLYRSNSGRKYENIFEDKVSRYKKGVTIIYTYTKGTYRFRVRSYNKYKGKKLYSVYSKVKKINL